MIFVNPWAYCSTDKDAIWRVGDPVGPDNDHHIECVARECVETGGFMIFGWGKVKRGSGRLKRVDEIVRATGCLVMALAVNGDGSPKHPLYLSATATPAFWPNR